MADQILTKDMLSDGSILLQFKKDFINDGDENSMMALLACLRDSTVWVPCHVAETDEKAQKVKLRPEILQGSDGGKFISTFSCIGEIPEEYAQGENSELTLLPVEFVDMIQMGLNMGNIDGIVVDGFTEALPVPFDICQVILTLPSAFADPAPTCTCGGNRPGRRCTCGASQERPKVTPTRPSFGSRPGRRRN